MKYCLLVGTDLERASETNGHIPALINGSYLGIMDFTDPMSKTESLDRAKYPIVLFTTMKYFAFK